MKTWQRSTTPDDSTKHTNVPSLVALKQSLICRAATIDEIHRSATRLSLMLRPTICYWTLSCTSNDSEPPVDERVEAVDLCK